MARTEWPFGRMTLLGLTLICMSVSRTFLAQESPTSGPPALIPYRVSGDGSDRIRSRWGYCDPNKRLVIAASYGDAEPFSGGLAKVVRDGKWGYIDARGKEA